MSALLALSLLSAAQDAQAEPAPVLRREVAVARLDIPDEIAAAVIPYLGCLMARDGTMVKGELDPRPKGERPTDCSATRAKAARNADLMMKRLPKKKAKSERRAFIEQTLVSIEEFQRSSLSRVPPPPPQDETE